MREVEDDELQVPSGFRCRRRGERSCYTGPRTTGRESLPSVQHFLHGSNGRERRQSVLSSIECAPGGLACLVLSCVACCSSYRLTQTRSAICICIFFFSFAAHCNFPYSGRLELLLARAVEGV